MRPAYIFGYWIRALASLVSTSNDTFDHIQAPVEGPSARATIDTI